MVVLSLSIRPSLSTTQDLINKICYSTENHGFCAGIFQNNTNNPNTDIARLCQISVTQTMEYATNTNIFVTKARDNARDNTTRDFYTVCEVRYEALLDEFEEANLALAKRDYRSMLSHEGKCDKFVSDCQQIIGNRVPELSKMNTQVRVLISMSLITTVMLYRS
ncbi:hypothetical protein F511_40580 [Dorcoceras hygrometricum]|uniref:Pectinesterase inhibitor domain-containing protein n=1 Tax=Dorcoceras hygrometricum TaxID=472368 RepID=A0A2Z7CTI4_9LAMI|nr:hypothetical protein F511_40580 [Dorcoceras hygrometricum]